MDRYIPYCDPTDTFPNAYCHNCPYLVMPATMLFGAMKMNGNALMEERNSGNRRIGRKAMKRLTERDECGNVYIIALDDIMPELYAELSFSETNALMEALNRLGAYEETGLLPEDCAEYKKEVKPVLKYAGAKWRLAGWITEQLPPHEIYLEPFFGSGAVFFRKSAARLETINDVDGNVVNLFRVLREKPEQLAALIECTPWARDEYYASYEQTGNDVEDARRFLVRCWQAFGTMTAARTGWRHSATGRSPVMPQQWNSLPERLAAAHCQ